MTFQLDTDAVAKIQLIEKITRSKVKDILDEEDKLIIVVGPGQLQKALGKDAANIKSLQTKFRKKIRIIEFADDPQVFLRNLCKPNKVDRIDKDNDTYTIVPSDYKSRGYLIGRAAGTLRKNEEIMRRYFTVDELKVEQVNE